MNNILVINAGSSSVKYQLINMDTESVLSKGNCEKIGLPTSFIEHKYGDKKVVITEVFENHVQAIKMILDLLVSKEHGVISSLDEITAVGHRVLHGGEIYKDAAIVDEEVLKNLEELKPLGPLHMPANIAGILACQEVMKDKPQVMVCDTAFHAQMPKEAYLYALPYEAYTDWKIRKYGFHGTSHKYVSGECAKLLGKDVKDVKVITVHLGNGSSIAAVKGGISVDTTMGFTPLEGLMMGTRCGDIDASVVEYVANKTGMSVGEVITYFNKKSGIMGISGVSSDMREINDAAQAGNERAKLIVPMLSYRIKKYIGAYMAALGGVDAIVFTGGIGEHQDDVRELCLEGLDFCGVEIDKEKNATLPRGTVEEITGKNSKVRLFRIPTNEELVIARETLKLTK